MAVVFLVVKSDEADQNPWIYCFSDPHSIYRGEGLQGFLEKKGVVLMTRKVDATPPADFPQSMCAEHAPAVEAIAQLDDGYMGGREMYHSAMAKLVELGMDIQRKLDKKSQETANQDVANGSR